MAQPATPDTKDHKTDRRKEQENELVLSYTTMRNLIGFGGMLLPFVLMFFTKEANNGFVEPSISDYYYTKNGDILVVLLSVLGVFLITYTGYNWKEWALTTLAAICALGVAFSPTGSRLEIDEKSTSIHTEINFGGHLIHFLFAGVFFIALAIVTLKYFPRSDRPASGKSDGKTTPKEKRNVVYRVCGWTMIGCVGSLLIYFLLSELNMFKANFPVVFVLETIAIEAFGISWLTKGETLLPDGEHYMMKAFRKVKEGLKGKK